MTQIAGRPAPPPEFDLFSDAYLRDPASAFVRAREEAPVFWNEALGTWVVTRRADIDAVLMDWETWSCQANGGRLPVPDEYADVVPPELVAEIMIGMDPPKHTAARKVAQRGFLKPVIEALAPEIEARAHRILDGFAHLGAAELMETYCLELTTQTLMALLGLSAEDEPMMRQLRDDHFRVLASGREPMPEPERSEVWTRYVAAQLRLRQLAQERRDGDGGDIITLMARAKDREGNHALSVERIAMHLTEFAAAGTDTTAQAMANAILFLSDAPEQRAEAQADPTLWARVFEETVRRRPSAPFASRVATQDAEIAGVTIPEGDMVWLALASANTDPAAVVDPLRFDIHRDGLDDHDHYAFTKGRHTCLGAPLGRTQGAIGLRVAYERLPGLRAVPDQKQDFLPLAMLPIRRILQVTWAPSDAKAPESKEH
ncbi:cytochrome P450 [Streptomyces violens]|uniref:cytochrome P450 n=1 Tax=Streptomyces violens TaxID=66377 RepID=UPI00055FA9C1|nr:cytochrome P450 [Streptomyces violens]